MDSRRTSKNRAEQTQTQTQTQNRGTGDPIHRRSAEDASTKKQILTSFCREMARRIEKEQKNQGPTREHLRLRAFKALRADGIRLRSMKGENGLHFVVCC